MLPALHKYMYRIKTYSTLILSPRDHHGFYLAAGDFTREDVVDAESLSGLKEVSDKVNIIYPFYQYGTYSKYEPKRAQYYIPGSSIKGALGTKKIDNDVLKLMVDDIRLKNEHIHLSHLIKVQYRSPNKNGSAYIDTFFPNVAVEMLKAGVSYIGELYINQEREELVNYLQRAEQITFTKLSQLISKIQQLYDQMNSEEDRSILAKLQQNIQHAMNNQGDHEDGFMLLIGGYKGNILAAEWNQDVESAIYLDMDKKLPHGLVQVTLE